jgi:hypothetical protein
MVSRWRKGRIEAGFSGYLGGHTMLSMDQFLRLISLPAVVAAFLIASQISGGISPPAQEYTANE